MSIRLFFKFMTGPTMAAIVVVFAGCAGEGGPGDPGGPGPGSEASAPLGDSPTTKQIMTKLGKGPNALTPVIGKELETDPPPWETIGPQTAEYARLALAMAKNEPRKGTKESWTELNGHFAQSAEALNKAAQAKDRNAALEAHGQLAGSCMQCHREHRMGPGGGPGGRGGPGGPGGPPSGPGGGFPKGGPPPPPGG